MGALVTNYLFLWNRMPSENKKWTYVYFSNSFDLEYENLWPWWNCIDIVSYFVVDLLQIVVYL
jgi:hypothetical protein